jgi:hypothetical protein
MNVTVGDSILCTVLRETSVGSSAVLVREHIFKWITL